MTRKTKIVATLGPVSESKTQIRALVQAGMNIARLNFSHGSEPEFKDIVHNLRAVEKEMGRTILTLQDLQGPKIRLGKLSEAGVPVKKGDHVTFCVKGNVKNTLPLPYPPLIKGVKAGHRLFIEDGLIRTKILFVKENCIGVEVLNSGILKSHKGVNIPDSQIPREQTLTEKDKKDLKFGVQTLKVDAVALSFVEEAQDIIHVRTRIQKMSRRPVFIVAKIERPKALINLEAIIEAADGIMVARGDLGVEIPAEQVPLEQKRIIRLCREQGKPVIVATQILDSMIEHPIPTRAETSDAATAIFEQTDAFMLSNETAVGQYSVQAVQTLARIAETIEAAMVNQGVFLNPQPQFSSMRGGIEERHLPREAYELADEIHARALVIATEEGYTARAIVRYRPKTPLLVVTSIASTARWMHFFWGVEKVMLFKRALRSEEVIQQLRAKKILKKDDRVVFVRLKKNGTLRGEIGVF